MKRRVLAVSTLLFFLALPLARAADTLPQSRPKPDFPQSSAKPPAPSPAARPKGIGKDTVDAFCGHGHPKPPAHGVQYDHKPALKKIMALKPGQYSMNSGTIIIIFENLHYLMKLPPGLSQIHATEGGDMLMGYINGGCSLEQLSEALRVNGLAPAAGVGEP